MRLSLAVQVRELWGVKMEGNGVKIAVVVSLMLVLMAGQAMASAKSCYKQCYHDCRAGGGSKFVCGLRCFLKCYDQSESKDHFYCRLGCSSSSCSHLDPDKADMEGCLESCSETCCKKT